MATWDASLPAPRISGYDLSPANQSLRTDMEFGAARSRRRSFARNDTLAVVWVFTDAQMATFRTWFESATEAAGGSAWFSISLAVGTTGIDAMEARFVGPWQAALQPGLNWVVTARIEVR